ncbi:MAG: hypothetical protein R2695_15065 [Acidimicrobiales bacterium]
MWISIRPELRAAVWDFADGDRLTCERADAFWTNGDAHDPPGPCAHLFTTDGARRTATVTLTWTIMRRTFEDGTWRAWRDLSLSAPSPIDVIELQAAIE